MPVLREAYPHLPRYVKYYKGSYAPKYYTQEVLGKVAELREKWGLDGLRERQQAKGQLRMGI